jgi:hypothetical protein
MTTTRTRKTPASKASVTVIPDDVKQPADRKPKQETEQTEMERIEALAETATTSRVDGGTNVTLCGFTVLVPDGANDDFELLAEVGQMDAKHARGDRGAIAHFPPILRSLAGEEGYKAALNGMRGENGRVPVREAIDYVNALLMVMKVSLETED